MDEKKLKEEARRIWKESDGWPYVAFVKLLFFASGYWLDPEFTHKIAIISEIISDLIKEDKNV